MADLPTGTVTFLFTDLEGSTARWERDRKVVAQAAYGHLEFLRSAITGNGGVRLSVVSDAVPAASPSAHRALAGRWPASVWPSPHRPVATGIASLACEATRWLP